MMRRYPDSSWKTSGRADPWWGFTSHLQPLSFPVLTRVTSALPELLLVPPLPLALPALQTCSRVVAYQEQRRGCLALLGLHHCDSTTQPLRAIPVLKAFSKRLFPQVHFELANFA